MAASLTSLNVSFKKAPEPCRRSLGTGLRKRPQLKPRQLLRLGMKRGDEAIGQKYRSILSYKFVSQSCCRMLQTRCARPVHRAGHGFWSRFECFLVGSLTRSIQPGTAALGLRLFIRPAYFRSIAPASGHQPTKGRDAASHSSYRMTKVPNPLRSNGLRSVLAAGDQYLSTMDTAGHKADDRFAGPV